jgi:hypothetical protein
MILRLSVLTGRAIGLIAALMIGLTGALVTDGRVAHLRLLAGDRMPVWAARLPDEAGLLRGHAAVGKEGAGWDLRWDLRRLALSGPVWSVQLTGPDTMLAGEMTLTGSGLRLAALTGSLDLAALTGQEGMPAVLARSGVSGQISLTGGQAVAGYGQGLVRRMSGRADARATAIGFDGHHLGDGPLVTTLAEGQWQMDMTLSGGVAPVAITLSGAFGAGRAQMVLSLEDVPTVPQGWRNALGLLASREGPRWVLTQTLDMPY